MKIVEKMKLRKGCVLNWGAAILNRVITGDVLRR